MPRTARAITAGICYHVINRGNNRAQVFGCSADYRAFAELITAAQERAPLDLLAACLMPNHFHFVVIPGEPDALARWMQWLLTTHVRRLHRREGTIGRVWQGRFKAFPIQHDEHLLTVMRYVERNALRAGLVDDALAWPWGSLAWRAGSDRKALLARCPVKLPEDWVGWVNAPQTSSELAELRTCVNRQRPYGTEQWVDRTAAELGLESSLRAAGRPFKDRGKQRMSPLFTSLTLGGAVAEAREPALAFESMWQALWSQQRMPPSLIELCRLRLAQLHGATAELEVENPAATVTQEQRESVLRGRFASDGQLAPGEVAVLSLAEVYAQDPAAITDAMADEVKGVYGDAGLVVLIEALGFLDGRMRMARLMNTLSRVRA